MKVTILGCAGTFPSAVSGCSSYLVRHDGFALLVDAGNGAVGALQRETDLFGVDAVLLSHLHADHCLDLIAYSYARRYHPDPPPRLAVYGPAGTHERLCQIIEPSPRAFEPSPRAFEPSPRAFEPSPRAAGRPRSDCLDEVYDFHTTRASTMMLGPFDVSLAQTAHPVECHAIRLSAGDRCLVYSADTGPSSAVVDVARDADLFLCEATWQDGGPHPPDLHLTAREAGSHAARAGVGSLLLVHTTAYLDQRRTLAEAADAWSGPLALAEPGRTYDV